MSNPSYEILGEVELSCASLKKRSDGIIEYTLTEDYILDLDDIKKIASNVHNFCDGKKHGMLVITTNHNGSTREARAESFESMKKKDDAIAEAIVISSLPTRIAADFFYKIYKPSHPCKFFKTKEKAEKWLFKMVSEYTVKE